MRNITLAVDEGTYRRARIAAAERNQSVSALVRQYLQGLKAGDSAGQDRTARLFSALDQARGFKAARRLTREQAHARHIS